VQGVRVISGARGSWTVVLVGALVLVLVLVVVVVVVLGLSLGSIAVPEERARYCRMEDTSRFEEERFLDDDVEGPSCEGCQEFWDEDGSGRSTTTQHRPKQDVVWRGRGRFFCYFLDFFRFLLPRSFSYLTPFSLRWGIGPYVPDQRRTHPCLPVEKANFLFLNNVTGSVLSRSCGCLWVFKATRIVLLLLLFLIDIFVWATQHSFRATYVARGHPGTLPYPSHLAATVSPCCTTSNSPFATPSRAQAFASSAGGSSMGSAVKQKVPQCTGILLALRTSRCIVAASSGLQ
jgi:hypothetical protein